MDPAAPLPEPVPPIAVPSGPPAPAGAKPARRPAAPRKTSRTAIFVALAAVGVFAPLAVWLAQQDPPRVTHAEAVNLALAIEQANALPAIERLVHYEVEAAPAAPELEPAPTPIAALIASCKRSGDYTFLDMRADTAGGRTLVFRNKREGTLLDYHELRLERHEDRVKVCELWSMRRGGWMRELEQERRELLGSSEHAAAAGDFLKKAEMLDAEQLEGAFQLLHRKLRTSRCIGLLYLEKIGPQNFLPFKVALVEFRSENPDNLAGDLLMLEAGAPGASQQEILATFKRMQARVGDEAFLGKLVDRLLH